MRIEGLELALSGQLNFLELAGLSNQVNAKAVDDNTGVRFLRQGNARGLDLFEVIKALKVGQNKRLILRLLKRGDLIQILYLLPKALLVNALRFFSKEKLLRMLMMLPKKWLLRLLLQLFSIEHMIKKMPTSVLFSILRSPKLTNREMVKAFNTMPPQFLQFIMMKMLGSQQVSGLKHSEIMQIFMDMDKRKILEGMKMLPFKALQPFVNYFVQRDPQLLENVSSAFIFKLMNNIPKPALIQACMVLPEDMIIQFLCQLPDQFLMLAAAQIDDATLEQYLISQQPGLLAALAA